jgi:hypothetical protein
MFWLLPVDVVLVILSFVDPWDFFSMERVCHSLRKLILVLFPKWVQMNAHLLQDVYPTKRELLAHLCNLSGSYFARTGATVFKTLQISQDHNYFRGAYSFVEQVNAREATKGWRATRTYVGNWKRSPNSELKIVEGKLIPSSLDFFCTFLQFDYHLWTNRSAGAKELHEAAQVDRVFQARISPNKFTTIWLAPSKIESNGYDRDFEFLGNDRACCLMKMDTSSPKFRHGSIETSMIWLEGHLANSSLVETILTLDDTSLLIPENHKFFLHFAHIMNEKLLEDEERKFDAEDLVRWKSSLPPHPYELTRSRCEDPERLMEDCRQTVAKTFETVKNSATVCTVAQIVLPKQKQWKEVARSSTDHEDKNEEFEETNFGELW